MEVASFFPNYKEIGFTKKTTGVKGKLRFHAENAFVESIFSANHCFFLLKGCMVPYFIISDAEEIAQEIIHFESCNNPEDAQLIVGKKIYLHNNQITEGEAKASLLAHGAVCVIA